MQVINTPSNYIKLYNTFFANWRGEISRTVKFSMVVLCSLFATACSISVVTGSKPNITVLENQLTLGKSTRQDVIRTLGEPFGKGAEMLPFRDKPRMTYTYYYEEGSLEDDRRIFLFVFLANDVYDGYMWFSSLPEVQP